MDRQYIKYQARELVRNSKPNPIWVGLVYLLIIGGASILVQVITALINDLTRLDEEMVVLMLMPLTIVVYLFQAPINYGFTKYCMNISRGEPGSNSTLFEMFSRFGSVLGASFLTGLATVAPLLVYIPIVVLTVISPEVGAVLMALSILPVCFAVVYIQLGYAMVPFILIDHPEKSITECMKESATLMKGRRSEYFTIGLSFIGWAFLAPYTLYILLIWLNPYMNVTYALYYDVITGKIPGTYGYGYPSNGQYPPYQGTQYPPNGYGYQNPQGGYQYPPYQGNGYNRPNVYQGTQYPPNGYQGYNGYQYPPNQYQPNQYPPNQYPQNPQYPPQNGYQAPPPTPQPQYPADPPAAQQQDYPAGQYPEYDPNLYGAVNTKPTETAAPEETPAAAPQPAPAETTVIQPPAQDAVPPVQENPDPAPTVQGTVAPPPSVTPLPDVKWDYSHSDNGDNNDPV